MTEQSQLESDIADVEAMGEAPNIVDWANAVRLMWPDLVRVVRAARAAVDEWDDGKVGPGWDHMSGAIRDLRLAIGVPERRT